MREGIKSVDIQNVWTSPTGSKNFWEFKKGDHVSNNHAISGIVVEMPVDVRDNSGELIVPLGFVPIKEYLEEYQQPSKTYKVSIIDGNTLVLKPTMCEAFG